MGFDAEHWFLPKGDRGVVDELSSRRCRFLSGKPILLANDQEWIFPAPTEQSAFPIESAGADYVALIHALQEAEDLNERRLAELALAIFLIELNYELRSDKLASLFTFQPRSSELANSQRAFESLARDHVLALGTRGNPYQSTASPDADRWQIGQRIVNWLRERGLLPKSLPRSPNGEVLS